MDASYLTSAIPYLAALLVHTVVLIDTADALRDNSYRSIR